MKVAVVVKKKEVTKTGDKWGTAETSVETEILDWSATFLVKKKYISDGSLISVATIKGTGVKTTLIEEGMYFTYREKKYLIEDVNNSNPRHTKITGTEL